MNARRIVTCAVLGLSLGLQWAYCLFIYGMGSSSIYAGDFITPALFVGAPTVAIVTLAWALTNRGRAVRVFVLAAGLHLLLYGWMLRDLAWISEWPGQDSWPERHPDAAGAVLVAAGAVLTLTASVWAWARRRAARA